MFVLSHDNIRKMVHAPLNIIFKRLLCLYVTSMYMFVFVVNTMFLHSLQESQKWDEEAKEKQNALS